MALTPKQQAFVDEYLKDRNGTQAAIRAGYSPKTADMQASRLLRNVKISRAVGQAFKEASEKAQVDAAWVLKRLADEAEADIADLYDEHGALKPVREWPKIWRQGLVQGIDVEELFEGRGESRERVGVVRKVKLDSRIKRTELLGKHVNVQAFKEQIEHSGTVNIGDRMAEARARAQKATDGV